VTAYPDNRSCVVARQLLRIEADPGVDDLVAHAGGARTAGTLKDHSTMHVQTSALLL